MEISIAGVSVMLAMPVNRDLPWQTALSLMQTQDACHARGIRFELQFQVGCSIVEMARSRIAHEFLLSDKSHLFCVDSDMEWQSDDFVKLLALGTRLEVVGGIYPTKADPPVFMIDAADGDELAGNEFGCLSVRGMGLGFTCVQRKVIEQLAGNAPRLKFPNVDEPIPHIYRTGTIDGKFNGEDMAFFADVRALGYPVWLDPTVKLGHVGAKAYSASFMDILNQQGAPSHGEEA